MDHTDSALDHVSLGLFLRGFDVWPFLTSCHLLGLMTCSVISSMTAHLYLMTHLRLCPVLFSLSTNLPYKATISSLIFLPSQSLKYFLLNPACKVSFISASILFSLVLSSVRAFSVLNPDISLFSWFIFLVDYPTVHKNT